MDTLKSISLLRKERELILSGVGSLSDDQFLRIPEGFKNNILWNLGHIIITQQVLYYTLSRLETHIPKELISQFRTGTSPASWTSTPGIQMMKDLLVALPQKAIEDFDNGKFREFRPYTTTTGVQLSSFEDAVTFNHFHEGVHTGIMLSMKNLFDSK